MPWYVLSSTTNSNIPDVPFRVNVVQLAINGECERSARLVTNWIISNNNNNNSLITVIKF